MAKITRSKFTNVPYGIRFFFFEFFCFVLFCLISFFQGHLPNYFPSNRKNLSWFLFFFLFVSLKRVLQLYHFESFFFTFSSGSKHHIIGGLFFLRFLCPSLLSPADCGFWEGPIPPAGLLSLPPQYFPFLLSLCLSYPFFSGKRALLLISKTLMNLSNGVSVGVGVGVDGCWCRPCIPSYLN